MKKYFFLIIPFYLFLGNLLQAQDMGYGFKAGLNFSNFRGPSEQDSNGMDLENQKMITGFHIGAIINFKFTDLAGLRTELMFSQKGSRYTYAGNSFQDFYIVNQANTISTLGMKEMSINITNAYIDIPIMGYFRATDWLEVSAGASVGFLVSSVAAGELRYSGTTLGEAVLEDIVVALDYNYSNDDGNSRNPEDSTTDLIDGQLIEFPRTIGAYYDHTLYGSEVIENFFNTVDLGLVAGINLFLNQGLSLGLRANYGLSDITNNEMDYSRQNLGSDGRLQFQSDKDVNFSLQASIGFSF